MTQDTCVPALSLHKGLCKQPVRFNLKKRAIRDSNDMVNLSSYNSDFLTGLFADVAKANTIQDSPLNTKRTLDIMTATEELVDEFTPAPAKKSCTALARLSLRGRGSTMNLTSLCDDVLSPKGINEVFDQPKLGGDNRNSKSLAKNPVLDSLAFQLNCVSESKDDSLPASSSFTDTVKIAFPNLPATVSDSSCGTGLTRATLVRQASNPENTNKESFGWFVDLDDNQSVEVDVNLPYSISSDSLAFQAPTAPKRVNDEAELEWAQAADTVDDVLGDFF